MKLFVFSFIVIIAIAYQYYTAKRTRYTKEGKKCASSFVINGDTYTDCVMLPTPDNKDNKDNNSLEFVLGVGVGVIGMMAKDKFFGNGSDKQLQSKQREIDEICVENEKFRKRNKEMEHQIEDLLAENKKIRNQAKSNDASKDDMEDELDDLKREVKKLRAQNDDLSKKVQEYKAACKNYEIEIEKLKDKQM